VNEETKKHLLENVFPQKWDEWVKMVSELKIEDGKAGESKQ
jgi:hypothetical protein